MKVKVESMISANGNAVPNQHIIRAGIFIYFQSYKTLIASKNTLTGKIVLDRDAWDYSSTTGKYRNMFLGEGIAETRKKIASGEYKHADLNK